MSHARIYTAFGLAAALLLPPAPADAQHRGGGRPATGRAVPRPVVSSGPVGRSYGPGYYRPGYYRPGYYPPYYYRPYYAYPRYYGPYVGGYGFGYPTWALGFGFGYGYPGWSVGVGFGFPAYGYGYGYPYAYPYAYPGYGYPAYGYPYRPYGGVRIDVPQRDAEVYVDGYFAGIVDQYDGSLQQLNLEPGTHQLEVRAPGFAAVSFEVKIDPGRTITYRTSLRPTP